MKIELRLQFFRLLITVIVGLLVLALQIQPAAAHTRLPSQEFAVSILAETESGPYLVSAVQYAANDFWIIEVPVESVEGGLPVGARAAATVVSVRTGVEKSRPLLRYQDTFIARLPLLEDSWNITITLSSEKGEGRVVFTTLPHGRSSSPIARGLVIATPFLLIAVGLFVYKRFGISLVQ